MTRRTSARALAREIYRQMVAARAASEKDVPDDRLEEYIVSWPGKVC